jgi:hypothetical protein
MGFFNTIKEGDTFTAVSDGSGGFNFKPKGVAGGGGEDHSCLIPIFSIYSKVFFFCQEINKQ